MSNQLYRFDDGRNCEYCLGAIKVTSGINGAKIEQCDGCSYSFSVQENNGRLLYTEIYELYKTDKRSKENRIKVLEKEIERIKDVEND